MTASRKSWRYRWALRKLERAAAVLHDRRMRALCSWDREDARDEAQRIERALDILKEKTP